MELFTLLNNHSQNKQAQIIVNKNNTYKNLKIDKLLKNHDNKKRCMSLNWKRRLNI